MRRVRRAREVGRPCRRTALSVATENAFSSNAVGLVERRENSAIWYNPNAMGTRHVLGGLGLLVIIACGGLGSDPPPITSVHEGSWDGEWGGGADNGTISFAVDEEGSFHGDMTNSTQGWDGPIEGSIGSNSFFDGFVTLPGPILLDLRGFLFLDPSGQQLSGEVMVDGVASQFVMVKI